MATSLSRPVAECLIVSANQVVTPYPVYPLGAACLVTALREAGHRASHFDLLADGGHPALALLLAGGHFDLVGVSIRNLDSVDSAAPEEYLAAIATTVDLIRAHSDAPLVLGGPAFSIMPGELMDLLGADFGVVGEGEELLPWLAGELAAGRPPLERLFRARPLAGLWQPSTLSASTADYYLRHGGMLNVQTKRGCPYACQYCSYPQIEGRTLRFREPAAVAEEVNRLRDQCGARYIFFADSFFNDSQGHYLEVAEALIRHGNTLPWCAFFRPQGLPPEALRLLQRAGLAAMELGTDAACDRTLAGIGKSFTFAEVLEVHRQVVAAGLACAHFVMFGGPDENAETLSEGLANLDRLERCVVFAFAGIRILPGTGIHARALADGVIAADTSLLTPQFYFSPQVSQEEVTGAIRRAFAGRLDRIYPCHEFSQRIIDLHKIGCVGPLWDLILKKRTRR